MIRSQISTDRTLHYVKTNHRSLVNLNERLLQLRRYFMTVCLFAFLHQQNVMILKFVVFISNINARDRKKSMKCHVIDSVKIYELTIC